jgi:hypothetical protein
MKKRNAMKSIKELPAKPAESLPSTVPQPPIVHAIGKFILSVFVVTAHVHMSYFFFGPTIKLTRLHILRIRWINRKCTGNMGILSIRAYTSRATISTAAELSASEKEQ